MNFNLLLILLLVKFTFSRFHDISDEEKYCSNMDEIRESKNFNIASGKFSSAFGFNCEALGKYSTALGYRTLAEGKYSTSIGSNTVSKGQCSFSIGRYNKIHKESNQSKPVFQIGNGDATKRHDAVTVLFNGKIGINVDNFVDNPESFSELVTIHGSVNANDFFIPDNKKKQKKTSLVKELKVMKRRINKLEKTIEHLSLKMEKCTVNADQNEPHNKISENGIFASIKNSIVEFQQNLKIPNSNRSAVLWLLGGLITFFLFCVLIVTLVGIVLVRFIKVEKKKK